MKRNIIIGVILVLVIVIANTSFVYARNWPTSQTGVNRVETITKNVWATVNTVVQILAVAAVVFAGLRYMFASSEGRADIKKDMGYLVIGAILVFGTTLVIQFIVNATNDVM